MAGNRQFFSSLLARSRNDNRVSQPRAASRESRWVRFSTSAGLNITRSPLQNSFGLKKGTRATRISKNRLVPPLFLAYEKIPRSLHSISNFQPASRPIFITHQASRVENGRKSSTCENRVNTSNRKHSTTIFHFSSLDDLWKFSKYEYAFVTDLPLLF